MNAITMRCPACHASNEFLAFHIARREPVTCSNCHADLGTWGSLKPDHPIFPPRPPWNDETAEASGHTGV